MILRRDRGQPDSERLAVWTWKKSLLATTVLLTQLSTGDDNAMSLFRLHDPNPSYLCVL